MTNIVNTQIEMHKATQFAKATKAFLGELSKGTDVITCPAGVSVPYFEQVIMNHGFKFYRGYHNNYRIF